MGTVTAMWQIVLIPLLTAAPAEPPAVAEKPAVRMAGDLSTLAWEALTSAWQPPTLPNALDTRSESAQALISSGCGPVSTAGRTDVTFSHVPPENTRRILSFQAAPQRLDVPAVAEHEQAPPPAEAERAPSRRPAVAEKPPLPTVADRPRRAEHSLQLLIGCIGPKRPEVADLRPQANAALTATCDPFWPLPYRVCGSSIGSDLCDRPAGTPLRMALGIAEDGELPIRLFKSAATAALAEYLVTGRFHSGSVVSYGDDVGFEAAAEAARRLLGRGEPTESELVRLTVPPVVPPWGPFPRWTHFGSRVAISDLGVEWDGQAVNCSPLNVAFGPRKDPCEPIAILQPDGDAALAAYTASLPGPVLMETSDCGSPSPPRDPAQLVSETFGMTAEWELDSLFLSGEDDERLADDVSAAFWQNVAGAGRTGSGRPSLAAELLGAWNEEAGAGAWSRGRREHLLDFGDDVLTADLSTERLPWTSADPQSLIEAIHAEQPAPTWSLPTR